MPLAPRKRAQGSGEPVSVRIGALMRRTRTKDPGLAMLVRVREVLAQNHVASAPVDVEALASSEVPAKLGGERRGKN